MSKILVFTKKNTEIDLQILVFLNQKILMAFLAFFLLLVLPETVFPGEIDINNASIKELKTLPFIGDARAKAIDRYRKTQGPILSLEELKNISAIGPSTFDAIKPHLTIAGKKYLQKSTTTSPQHFEIFQILNSTADQITLLPNARYFDKLISHIKGANNSILITMFIFKTTTSPKNRPAIIANELIKAAKRGVDVRVLLDKSGYDASINKENQKVANKLRRNGVKVFFDNEKKTTHAKLVVIDQRFCLLGSHNFTHSALAHNNEYSILIDSKSLAEELSSYIRSIN